jgi:hypothetical protein
MPTHGERRATEAAARIRGGIQRIAFRKVLMG